jgi:hypothetical protein
MSALETGIAGAINSALTGAPDIGIIIRGALAEILAHLASDSATVSIEYGSMTPEGRDGQVRAGVYDGRLEVFLDVYWAGPPSVWEARVYEARAEIHRRIMSMALPSRVVRIRPLGYDAPEINTEGDAQHVVLRCNWLFDVRHSITDPEA